MLKQYFYTSVRRQYGTISFFSGVVKFRTRVCLLCLINLPYGECLYQLYGLAFLSEKLDLDTISLHIHGRATTYLMFHNNDGSSIAFACLLTGLYYPHLSFSGAIRHNIF